MNKPMIHDDWNEKGLWLKVYDVSFVNEWGVISEMMICHEQKNEVEWVKWRSFFSKRCHEGLSVVLWVKE